MRSVLALVMGASFAFAWYAAFTIGLLGFGAAMAVSAACAIAIEWLMRRELRQHREAVWARRDNDWHGPKLARCMDCGGWWSLDSLALTGGACGHCVKAGVRSWPGTGGGR